MSPQAKKIAIEGRRLQVSLYDRVSSWLLTFLITVGATAALLLVLWLSSKLLDPQIVAVPVVITEVSEDGEGGGDGRPAGGSQLVNQSEEPFVGKDKETTDVEDSLSVLDNAVASRAAELDDPSLIEPTRHGSFGSGGGIYGGFGDGRGMGHGPGKPGFPRHWEVMFSKSTLELYARQLESFGIELGVLQPDNKIIYVFHLTKRKPDTRTVSNPSVNEKRYYLTWRTGEMQQADRELLARAGVDPEDRLILKFLPKETELALIGLERGYRGTDPRKIAKTRFGVRPLGDKYEFFIIEQAIKR